MHLFDVRAPHSAWVAFVIKDKVKDSKYQKVLRSSNTHECHSE